MWPVGETGESVEMRKPLWAIAGALAALAICVLVAAEGQRYDLLRIGGDSALLIRLDRRTGDTCVLHAFPLLSAELDRIVVPCPLGPRQQLVVKMETLRQGGFSDEEVEKWAKEQE